MSKIDAESVLVTYPSERLQVENFGKSDVPGSATRLACCLWRAECLMPGDRPLVYADDGRVAERGARTNLVIVYPGNGPV